MKNSKKGPPLLLFIMLAAAFPIASWSQEEDSYARLTKIFEALRSQDLDRMENIDGAAFEERASRVDELRLQLEEIRTDGWEVPRKVDYMLAYSRLSRQRFEHSMLRPWRRDAGFYVDRIAQIPFRELPADAASLAELEAELQSVALALGHARDNLTEGSSQLAAVALRQLERDDGVGHGYPYREIPPAGVIGWYEDLLQRVRVHHPQLTELTEAALAAVKGFRDWLQEEATKMNRAAGVGPKPYAWYLRNVQLIPIDPEEILVLGTRELHQAHAFLAIEEARNQGLPQLTPASDAASYEQRIAEADALVRRFLRERKILTLPPDVPQFDHNVPWVRREGGRLNFWEAVQYRDPLPDHVHAVVPGHRFDSWLHAKDQRPIRSEFFDSGRVEGWAFYVEEMLLQSGLLDDRPRTRELFYLFQAARAVRNRAEIALQLNRWSVPDAVRYMVSNVPLMDEDVARVDSEIYLRRPGYGVSYLVGKVQIEQLLSARRRQLGDGFDLTEFHDQFLASGWIPISLIQWEMTGSADHLIPILKQAGIAVP